MESKYFDLTNSQKRIWYTQKIYLNSSMFNIGGKVQIHGNIDVKKLCQAIKIVIDNNDSLSIKFVEKDEQIFQYFSSEKCKTIDYIDFSQECDPERSFEQWYKKGAETPLTIDKNELYYFAVYKIRDGEYGYFTKVHHIVADGWSMQLFVHQVTGIYESLVKEETLNFRKAPSYLEFIETEREYLNSSKVEKNRKFWMEKLKNLPELPPINNEIDGKRKHFYMNEDETKAIKKFCKDNNISLNTFFITLYLMYVYKMTGQKDILISNPVMGRTKKVGMNTFGMGVNSLILRFVINEEYTILQTIKYVLNEVKRCFINQRYPYNYILKNLSSSLKKYVKLYNTCINYYNTKLPLNICGIPIDNMEFYNGQQEYSLQLIIREWLDHDKLQIDFDYKISEYTDIMIENMYSFIRKLAIRVIKEPLSKVGEIQLLDEKEKEKVLYEFNDTDTDYPKDKTVVKLFMEHARKNPNAIALSSENEKITYRELDSRSNKVAVHLRNKGVKSNSIVGLIMTNSIELVVCILGILKANGTYLPIDTEYPDEHILYMLKDAKVNIILTNVELSIQDKVFKVITVNTLKNEINLLSDKFDYNWNTSDLAYIIYTSGSTGKPKGTLIRHKELMNYAYWAKDKYITQEHEIFPLYTSISFDLTVTSIYIPLISGNEVRIYRNDEYKNALFKIIEDNKCTVMKLTPSHLALLYDFSLKDSSIKKLIVGGENLATEAADRILKAFNNEVIIYNEYGPTETTVGCMIYKYDPNIDKGSSVPIGKPINNTKIYILDDNLKPLPVGMIGQIYISGDCISEGYLNREEITKERFIKDIYCKTNMMYKSGDLGKFISFETIEYVGRADSQIKIRGHRIELNEIEQALLKINYIKNVFVTFYENENSKLLCAYYNVRNKITGDEIKEFMTRILPNYMVPSFFIEVEEIPLTVNGKVDKSKLPKPSINKTKNEDFKSNSNKMENEEVLLEVMNYIFNMKNIDLNDDFFLLGGDSIKAIQASSKLMEKGFKLNAKDIMISSNFKKMAKYMQKDYVIETDQDIISGEIPVTPIIEWFFSLNLENENYYNQTVVLNLKKEISKEKIAIVLKKLIEHHDSLRLNYDKTKKVLYYNNNHLNEAIKISEYDLKNISEEEIKNSIKRIRCEHKSKFDISKDLLIKACIINSQPRNKILITAHHLVIDGVSWKVIIQDFYRILKQILSSEEIDLPPKTNSYLSWARMLSNYKPKELQIVDYWKNILACKNKYYEEAKITLKQKENISRELYLNEEETKKLIDIANKTYNTNLFDLIVVATVKVIEKLQNSRYIIFELEGHGRYDSFSDIDISRTVGWFTIIYPFMIKKIPEQLSELIVEVKEELRKIPNNGFDYGILKYLKHEFSVSDNNLVRLNYLGEIDDLDNNLFSVNYDAVDNVDPRNKMDSLMDINCYLKDNQLHISFSGIRNLEKDKILDFVELYHKSLVNIIDLCGKSEQIHFTPSDFSTIDLSMDELDSLF
ncbi:hypothetical protein N496_04000 [Clostridium botulinum A2B3 87]|uniref:non-ribosomal peptide synthetase n=1 Tax=Clostridium botulinum TaxID=1491 RepID=UPI0004A57907|nr:non-ribosomal peptide synthetase [Clostridium botulinum]KEI98773.1 hypothetical protein N496_04000 [Clostridium botulinum A2B3 87]